MEKICIFTSTPPLLRSERRVSPSALGDRCECLPRARWPAKLVWTAG
jgi:hypothetical protein